MHQFKELIIWQKSRLFCSEIYLLTSKFPAEEKIGLTNLLRRASLSISSNITKGSSRNSNKDFSRFLDIANGSAHEIETQILIASDLNFITIEESDKLGLQLIEIVKMISKLSSSLKIQNV